jgi:DNA repair protein RadC
MIQGLGEYQYASAPTLKIRELFAYALADSADEVERIMSQADALLGSNRSISSLSKLSVDEIAIAFDIDSKKAKKLLAMLTIGYRLGVSNRRPKEVQKIQGPDDVFKLLEYMQHETQEQFIALYLDASSTLIKTSIIHLGTGDCSLVGTKEVFREAVREGAVGIIIAHNHPSGDAEPSTEDIEITGKLIDAGRTLDIEVCDHVIIGMRQYTSLKKAMLM